MPRAPSLFLFHGAGPAFFMESARGHGRFSEVGPGSRAEDFFKNKLPAQLPTTLAAILVVSAHFETSASSDVDFEICSGENPEHLYDYYGFPDETYRLKYNAKGSPSIAAEAASLLRDGGMKVKLDPKAKWDHGVFLPLMHLRPSGDVPIVSMSVNVGMDPAMHIAAGRLLAPLREKGVLILGSGAATHGPASRNQGIAFSKWIRGVVNDADGNCLAPPALGGGSQKFEWTKAEKSLINWEKEAPFARKNHAREEHFLPLMVNLGAAMGSPGRTLYSDIVIESISLDTFIWD